jgi:hypothetical protein
MPLRTRILLTYATGIALLWMGLFWLRHVFPASKFLQSSPAAAKASEPAAVSPGNNDFRPP